MEVVTYPCMIFRLYRFEILRVTESTQSEVALKLSMLLLSFSIDEEAHISLFFIYFGIFYLLFYVFTVQFCDTFAKGSHLIHSDIIVF